MRYDEKELYCLSCQSRQIHKQRGERWCCPQCGRLDMTHEEQGREMLQRLGEALRGLARFDGFRASVTEDEVGFRYDAVVGVLIMAINDTKAMLEFWEAADDTD